MHVVRYSYDSSDSAPVKHGRVTYDIPAVTIEYEVKPKTYVALTADERKRFDRFLHHQGIAVTYLYGNVIKARINSETVYERCRLNPINLSILDDMCQIALNESYDRVRAERESRS